VARAEAYLPAEYTLIHPTVWPQYTNVTDRTDNGPIAQGEPFYKKNTTKEGMISVSGIR